MVRTVKEMLVIILTSRGQCRAGAFQLVSLVLFSPNCKVLKGQSESCGTVECREGLEFDGI